MDDSGHGYEVGYRKPPRAHQFRKGTSGNKNGRPSKRSQGPQSKINPFLDMVLFELERPLRLREAGESIDLTAVQAVLRSTIADAVKGNHRARDVVLRINEEAQRERQQCMIRASQWAYEHLVGWEDRAADAARMGEPPPLPHPAHVICDPFNNIFEITGPVDQAHHEFWEGLKIRLKDAEQDLGIALRRLSKDPDSEEDLELARDMRKKILDLERLVPAGWNPREELEWPQ